MSFSREMSPRPAAGEPGPRLSYVGVLFGSAICEQAGHLREARAKRGAGRGGERRGRCSAGRRSCGGRSCTRRCCGRRCCGRRWGLGSPGTGRCRGGAPPMEPDDAAGELPWGIAAPREIDGGEAAGGAPGAAAPRRAQRLSHLAHLRPDRNIVVGKILAPASPRWPPATVWAGPR